MMTEQKRFATPSSGRTWKKGRHDGDAIPDDDEMVPMVGVEAYIIPVLRGLGGGGGGKGGGGTDLTMVLMEEQMQEMQRTITAMKQQIDGLRA